MWWKDSCPERERQNDLDDVPLPVIESVYLLIYRITWVQRRQLSHSRARSKFVSPLSSSITQLIGLYTIFIGNIMINMYGARCIL